MRFDPSNLSLKFWESAGTPSPKVGVAWGVRWLTPSHSPSLPGVSDVTPRLPLGPHLCNPFCLGREPKARVATVLVDIELCICIDVTCKSYEGGGSSTK
jgi:hypothetical protein